MSDEQADTKTSKRPPGRPKGSKGKRRNADRDPIHKPMRENNDRAEMYEFIPYEAHDKFYIDRDIVKSAERDWGIALMWVALEVLGKPLDDFVAARRRNHWEEMRKGDCEGMFDHLGHRDGVIKVENMVLMRQPIEVQAKARLYEKRQAAAAITNMRQSHATEGVDVKGGDHPSALAKNRHRTSYEEGPKIPD